MNKVAEIINAAADLVETGWTQFDLDRVIEGTNCYCAVGALQTALMERGGHHGVWLHVVEALERAPELAKYDGHIAGWNDAEDQTQAEVVRTLRAIAKRTLV